MFYSYNDSKKIVGAQHHLWW